MDIMRKIEQEQISMLTANNPIPEFGAGDTLKVTVKVTEGTRERLQAFEGVCIARKNASINSAFTVRKVSYGEGVERRFPLYSPNITITVIRRGKVRRAKLYYLRDRSGKSARIVEKTDYFKKAANAAQEAKQSTAKKSKVEEPSTDSNSAE